MAIEKDLLDQLLAGRDPKDMFNKDGLVDELKKALSQRILNAEIDEHLDGDSGEAKGKYDHRLRATLRVCLQTTGTTIERAIWSGRLAAARRDLLDPRLSDRSVTAIAFSWAFNDAAHFSRSFSKAGRSARRSSVSQLAGIGARLARARKGCN